MEGLLTLGQILAHYRVLSRLGAGAMGEVYKAQDSVLGRPVALKILLADSVEDKGRLRRFIQEAKAASALNHPHIVTIYEIGQAKPKYQDDVEVLRTPEPAEIPAIDQTTLQDTGSGFIHYIAMEFVDGETLHAKIHGQRTDLKKLLDYLAQVAEGLAAAHAAGIIHRDLKPENIMIRQDGYAKLLDFGIAKLTETMNPPTGTGPGGTLVSTQGTEAGAILGTVGYMAPEQVEGKAIDHRVDIFSFGCILYEAIARKQAFEGNSVVDTLYKILYREPKSFGESLHDLPAGLVTLVGKCLAKDPANRYQSIADVATALTTVRKTYDQPPPRTVSTPAMPKPDIPKPTTLGSGVYARPSTISREPPITRPGVSTQQRTSPILYIGLAAGVLALAGIIVPLIQMWNGPAMGKLRLDSSPPGADVYLDDVLRGNTPLGPMDLKVGAYRVRLDLKGYQPRMDTIDVAKNGDVVRTYRLTPLMSTAPGSSKGPRAPRGIRVTHSHLFRHDCKGHLNFDGELIEYRTSGDHAFKLPLKNLTGIMVAKDKITIQGADVPGGRIDLRQEEPDAKPSLADYYARIVGGWRADAGTTK